MGVICVLLILQDGHSSGNKGIQGHERGDSMKKSGKSWVKSGEYEIVLQNVLKWGHCMLYFHILSKNRLSISFFPILLTNCSPRKTLLIMEKLGKMKT